MQLANIRYMYQVVKEGRGFDAIVVVFSSKDQAEFWQTRLEASKSSLMGTKTRVITVEEDWPGGAGQLLGTLYAWRKAQAKFDLARLLKDGGAVAIYHTAGKGMRMSPLPAAEANNKSAIKLPRLVKLNGHEVPLTLLEAVIFQTQIFAPSRQGRLCVFWGDQIFIPAKEVDFEGGYHAEIFNLKSEVPLEEEIWKRDWQSYGLIIPTPTGEVLQREKQTWEELKRLVELGVAKPEPSGKLLLGKSLGSFSISYDFLQALLGEFDSELRQKQGKLNTDPDLWMPLTSTRDDFSSWGRDLAYWERINRFKQRFMNREQKGFKLLGGKDLGAETFWWDYGQVKLFYQNLLKLLDDSFEGECMRKFYNLETHWLRHYESPELVVENSFLINSRVKGKVSESLLLGVEADHLESSRSIIINSLLSQTQAKEALIYNCIEFKGLNLKSGEVAADVFLPSKGKIRMKTELGRDGKEDWQRRIPGNYYTYEELCQLLEEEDLKGVAAERTLWEDYYLKREEIRESLKELGHKFIKPATDNLVEVVWGGSYIERLKGLPSSGKKIGESWECSTHPQHPSRVKLREGVEVWLPHLVNLMSEEILGREIAREFKGSLPILVKFIDAREDLSVQVHPSDEKARELGEKDTGKNEAWLVLHAEEGSVLYLGFKEDVDKAEFEKAVSSPEVNIAQKYLNAIPVKKGDIFFNPAGTIHAIGKGVVLVEIQQSSGVTYRVWDWNRVPKRPLHVKKALESLNFKKSTRQDFERKPRRLNEKEERLLDSFYFSVDRLSLVAGDEFTVDTKGSFQVLSCLEGKVELIKEGTKEHLSSGESLLVPAALGSYKIVAVKNSVVLKSFVLTTQCIDPVIFQTYDVRAPAEEYLPDRVAYYLGKGYGTFLRRQRDDVSPAPSVAVGGGIRLSTERIRPYLIKGLLSSGVNVYDVGITSTPELYFAIPYLGTEGGINITASHNEAEYNGLKQVIRSKDGFITSINAEEMLQIKETVLRGDFLEGEGKYTRIAEGEVARYHNELVKANCRLGREIWIYLLEKWGEKRLKALLDITARLDFPEGPDEAKWQEIRNALGLPSEFEQPSTAIKHPLKGLKVVIDFGNGSTWRTKQVYLDLGAEVIALNENPDGSFPAHIPDPIKAKYRKQLEEAVIKEAVSRQLPAVSYPKEVVGIGHDEDGDRVIYVRSDGRVVEGDRTLAIQAKQIIKEHRQKRREGKPRFMGEVKFSRIAEEFITAQGGEYIMNPTGFAFIKDGTKTLIRALRQGLPEVNLFGRKVDLRENKQPIVLAAELSGHQMSGHEENWIFDDGTLAAVKVLTVIANGLKEGKTFIDLDEEVPRYPASPELNIRLPTNVLEEKQEIVDKVVELFEKKGYPIDTTDGGLIKWLDKEGNWLGQALIRKSNTQPMIICRTEGKTPELKEKIEAEFFGELSRISTQAVPKLDLSSDDYVRGILPRIL